LKKFGVIIALMFFSVFNANAQAWVAQENTYETNWNVSVQLGSTALLNELHADFSGSGNDMNNLLDWGFGFSLGKMVLKRFDLGIESAWSNYKGYRKNSSNVNWLMLHPNFNNDEQAFLPFEIYYDTDIINIAPYIKYNFINFSTWTTGYLKLNLYVKLGLGIALPSTELGYADLTNYDFTGLAHPLYAKGRYGEVKRSVHFYFSPAFGLNYQLSDRVFISAESSFQFIGADYIDGIQNFKNNLNPETPDHLIADYRINVLGFTTKFMIGATYFFNFSSYRKETQLLHPFFTSRYRSYYSKYQRSSTHKARQERLPFFNDKLKD
jgi:hypothetical protein